MIFRRVLLFVGVSTLSVAGWSRDITYVISELNGPKQIQFESAAPMESIAGRAERVSGTVTLDPGQPGLALRAVVTVPVASMTTDLPTRDEHMKNDEWLCESRYPAIRFDLMGADSKATPRGTGTWFVNAVGQFTLKGISRTVTVPTTLRLQKVGKDDRLILEGRFPVPLEQYNVHGPAAMRMIGLKVASEVQVSFKLIGVAEAGWSGGGSPTPQKVYVPPAIPSYTKAPTPTPIKPKPTLSTKRAPSSTKKKSLSSTKRKSLSSTKRKPAPTTKRKSTTPAKKKTVLPPPQAPPLNPYP